MMLSVVQLVVIMVIFIVVQVTITESACLRQFYHFGARDSSLWQGVEASSQEILLDPPLLFYGKNYGVCHVQNNGIITFGDAPTFFSGTLRFPVKRFVLIAPFYGDVSTLITGNIWYRRVSKESHELKKIKEDIKNIFSNDSDFFSPKYALIATWYRVGHFHGLYAKTDKVNTFQCVITTDGVKSFAIFLYNEMQWALEYDPLFPARVGFSDGTSNKAYELPASGTQDILHTTAKSNVRRPGIWVFRIDGINILSPHPITNGVTCSPPTHPINGTIEPYNCTEAGAVIQFHCNKNYAPTKWRTAECQLNGSWAPDPAQLICTHNPHPFLRIFVFLTIPVAFLLVLGGGIFTVIIVIIKRRKRKLSCQMNGDIFIEV